jgi:hypothetical protein
MKSEVVGKHTVLFYESMDEMPIKNFNKLNKYLLIDSGIGSTLADFDKHIGKLSIMIEAGEKEKALTILENMRQLFWKITNEDNVSHLAFACFIHSIDGERITDLSETNLKEILNKLDADQ